MTAVICACDDKLAANSLVSAGNAHHGSLSMKQTPCQSVCVLSAQRQLVVSKPAKARGCVVGPAHFSHPFVGCAPAGNLHTFINQQSNNTALRGTVVKERAFALCVRPCFLLCAPRVKMHMLFQL